MASIITATMTLSEPEARKAADSLEESGADAVDLHEETPGTWQVTAYFADADESRRKEVQERLESAISKPNWLDWKTLPDADWVTRSQEALPPVRAGRILVYGQHVSQHVRENDIAIRIEAGQAFGTGHHATTRGCLLAIQAIAKKAKNPRRPIRSALDLGTGSGVLAIACAKLGIPVEAVDIDPVAIRIARENARLNAQAARVTARPMPALQTGLPDCLALRPFDLVVANIVLAPLLALAPTIARLVAPNGTLILSGLLPDQRVPIVATYRSAGLALQRWFVHDGWLTVVLGHRSHRGEA